MTRRPRQIIQRAMRLCMAIGVGRNMTASEAEDGLDALNSYVDFLKTQRLTIYVEKRNIFPLTSGQGTYTIGDGGDFDVPRPLYLPRASTLSQNADPQPLELPIDVLTTQDWQSRVPVKNVTSPLPTMVYYDYADEAGLGNITFFPIPNVGNVSAVLYLPTSVETFSSLTEEVDFAPGYYEMLCFNFAVRYAAEFGLTVPVEVVEAAKDTMAGVKRANIRLEVMRCDHAIAVRRGGRYNWISDTNA